MRVYKIGVLGATGAVGEEMMRVMEERRFPVGLLVPLASARSAGKAVRFGGETLPVCAAEADSFRGLDYVLGAVPSGEARRFAPMIRAAGAVFIDNSSAFRADPTVPLVVPEINPADAAAHEGLLSNPNCVTILSLAAVQGLSALSPIRSMRVTSFQAVSGAGRGGMAALETETRALLTGERTKPTVFPHPIAQNVIPQIGAFLENGYTEEELKLQNEGRKILHSPAFSASCTCVRVPVLRSHSMAITVTTESAISVSAARKAIAASPSCRLADEPTAGIYPTPLAAANRDEVLVGRIRRDLVSENALTLFCAGDQLRKGAATNAVQILELLTG